MGLVLSLAAILVVPATLQYRLITQVSAADRVRTQISLETAVDQFLQDFYTELVNVCAEFRPEPGIAAARDWKRIAARYEDWTRTARHPQLVADIYVWEAGNGGGPRLLRLDQKDLQFVPAAWPSDMQALEARFLAGAKAERPAGYLAVRLSMDNLRNRLLPELVHRHFGAAYRVEVLDTESPILRSDPTLPVRGSSDSDFSVKLLSAARGALVISPEYGEGRWQLLVKYRAGSLAAAIAPLRRRNLALSFGVLLLLAAGTTLILVFTQRVERLAKLQMDFVAGVSHELRTPLTVICSAADGEEGFNLDLSPRLVRLRGFEARTGAIALTNWVQVQSKDPAAGTKLVFHRYGDKYFLSEVSDEYDSIGMQLSVTHTERELSKTASTQAPEIVAVLARPFEAKYGNRKPYWRASGCRTIMMQLILHFRIQQ